MDLSNLALKMFGLQGTIAGGEALNNMGSTSDLPGLAQEYAKARAERLAKQQGSLASAAPVPYPTIGGPMVPQAPQAASPWTDWRPGGVPRQISMSMPPSSPGAPAAPAAPSVPMPMARPPQAPQASPMASFAQVHPHQNLFNRVSSTLQGNPDPSSLIGRIAHTFQGMGQPSADSNAPGFFQRNAAMMRDPSSGSLIDPAAAAQAPRGPDLINKMMGYLHAKPFGDIGNNNDPSTMGSG